MKTIYRSLLCANLVLAFLAIAGCDFFFGLDSPSRAKSTGGKVTVSLVAAGEYVNSSSRTVLPSTNPGIENYELLGALSGGSQASLGTWTSLAGANVLLDEGTWDFTLEATNSDGDVFLSDSLSGVILSNYSVSLNFTLEPLSSGTGSVSVTVTWPLSVSVASAVPAFNGSAGSVLSQSSDASTTSVTYAATVETGKYLFVLSLNDASGNLLASVPEIVRVYPNMASAKTIALSANDFNSAPAAPSNVTVTHVASTDSTGSVLVSWTDNSTSETGFEISDGTTTLATADPAATSATIISLTRGTSCTFQVRAINSFGNSDYESASGSYYVPALLAISFDANGGSGTIADQVVESGISAALSANAYSLSGYRFDGWAINADASRAEYVDGASYAIGNENATLHARWSSPLSDFTYTTSNGKVTITKYTGSETSVIIPSLIDGYPVARLYTASSAASGVFYNKNTVSSIVIPSSVTDLGRYAFYNCTSLESIVIPSSVNNLGSYAFYNCTSLDSITIPDSVTSIGQYAFYNCTSLDSITIPDSVTSIDFYIFSHCTNLTSITIPSSVTSIEGGAFYDCARLGSITIPSSVTSIGDRAFSQCTSLTSITIPSSVTSTGIYMFSHCTNLVSISIPSSVTSIRNYAFEYCTSLESITIPSSVTSIGIYTFSHCTSLASITIPSSVTSIGGSAFEGCSNLTSITIPSSVTSIGDSAFDYCTSLASIIVDPSNTSYSSVDEVLFNKDLTALNWYPAGKTGSSYTIPSSVTSIGNSAFKDCSSLASITIPASVTNISDYLFDVCSNLTSIVVPDSVTSIGDFALRGCSSLASITIPASVTSIGDSAFRGCSSLASITIPASVTNISNLAFYTCSSLANVYMEATTPPTLGGSLVFSSNKSGRLIYVLSESVSDYQTAAYWSEYASAITSE